MEASFTLDTMIKEIKANLNKYENWLKTCEIASTPKTISEIDKIQKTIDKNIKLVQSMIVKEEHRFIWKSYKELKEELNNRYKWIKKTEAQKNEKAKMNSWFNQSTDLNNRSNIDNWHDEKESLKKSIMLSNDILNSTVQNNLEWDDQEKRWGKSSEQVVKILKKVPIIEQMFGRIKFHKIKEKIILGIVIGVIVVWGWYLTFYR